VRPTLFVVAAVVVLSSFAILSVRDVRTRQRLDLATPDVGLAGALPQRERLSA